MIRHTQGNLLAADMEARVNAMNSVGVMGKGIALQFREAFPHNDERYRLACQRGEVLPGRMLVVPTAGILAPRFIIHFPTQRPWRAPSRLEDVALGLAALADVTRTWGIRSLAVPALGCRNGGLDWAGVWPMIAKSLGGLEGVEVRVFGPAGSSTIRGREACRPQVSQRAS